jgi:hypothetical protein
MPMERFPCGTLRLGSGQRDAETAPYQTVCSATHSLRFMVETLIHSPEHHRAVGRVVIAGSGIESVVANIAARLLLDPAKGIEQFAGRPFKQVLDECRKLARRRLPAERSDIRAASLQSNVLGWLDRAEQEANRRNPIVHATWLKVDKPLPGTVAYAHFGVDSRASGSALVQQVSIVELDQMAMGMESVLFIGLLPLGRVDDFLNVST